MSEKMNGTTVGAWLNRLAEFLREQRSVRWVAADRIYENSIESHGDSVEAMSVKTIKRFDNLIKDSVYVDFLNRLGNKEQVQDSEIQSTRYYQEARECLRAYGSYQGAVDESGLVDFCRRFLGLYAALKCGVNHAGPMKVIRAACDHFQHGYPRLFKIADSEYWMVGNGHHRIACLYTLGQKKIKAVIENTVIRRDSTFAQITNGQQARVSLSIIVPTYNRAGSIGETLDCLLKQKVGGDTQYEIIVIDNNSRDQTREVVEHYVNKFPGKVRYLFEPKQARAHALNAGIKVARGFLIACTDDDCLVGEDYARNVLNAFEKAGPQVGMIGGRIRPHWIGGTAPGWLSGLFSQPARYVDGSFNRNKIIFEGVVGILDLGNEPLLIDEARKKEDFIQLFGANTALRKEVIERHGAYAAFNKIGEDTEMCARLIAAGIPCLYDPSVEVFHKIPIQNGTPQFYYRWWYKQGIHKDLRQRYGHQIGIPLDLLRRFWDYGSRFIREKDPLLKVQWRMYAYYQLGQMANMLNQNFIKRNTA